MLQGISQWSEDGNLGQRPKNDIQDRHAWLVV